jgi:hypothetical protein
MKPTIENLKDTFKISYDVFEDSRLEALKVLDYYHNRQYTKDQLNVLNTRGQPAETFNVIKLFGRMLLGYYSTIVNNIKVIPAKEDNIITAQVLQDTTDYVFRTNNFNSEGDKIKLDCILTGLMCSYTDIEETGESDEFGRPKYKINIHHVPSTEILLDPMSRLDDYSDAKYIHRYKWVSQEDVDAMFGKAKREEIDAYYNSLDVDEADFTYTYNTEFQGRYKRFDNYLIVHSIIIDNDKSYSIYWCQDEILSKKEITYKEVKNPYRIQKLNNSNKAEFYGQFREVMETQDAINQALLKIQLMVNTQKAFVEDGAVDNLSEFTNQFNRVNAIIPVKDLAGIKIENLTREVIDQYTVIDKSLDRIQRVLSINDSFLGMAYASDSGAKVKLQQNASAVAQRYIVAKIEQFYRLLGWDIVNLIKQYFTATDIIRVSDNYQGNKWVELNKPLQIPTGQINPQTGQPILRMVFEEVIEPETGKPAKDKYGNIIMAPIPTLDTDIAFAKADIEIDTVSFNDDDQQNQALLEQFINGPLGNLLSQVNPVGYFQAGSLSVKNTRSKYSLELADILDQTSQMLQGQQVQAMQQGQLEGQMPQEQAMNNKAGRAAIGGQ